jgi:capsular exopolysaccharide synthesis family protein
MSRLFDELRQSVNKNKTGAQRPPGKPEGDLDRAGVLPPNESDDAPGSDFRVCSLHIDPGTAALTFGGPSSRVSEEYRMIRTRILYDRTRVRTVLVSSPGPGDGKTTTAFNLASTLALKSENRVLLIEADLRRPSLSGLLRIPQAPGLGNVLSGKCPLQEAVILTEQCPNLCLLPAGDALGNPAELLDNRHLHSMLAECSRLFNICILDGPPVASVADYDLLQNAVDSVVLVARQDHTSRVSLKSALTSIPKQKLLGVVLNCVDEWFLWKGPSHAYYTGYYTK